MFRLAVITSYFPLRGQSHRGHSAFQTLGHLREWLDIEVFVPLSAYPSWLKPRNFLYERPDPWYSPVGMTVRYIEYPALPLLSRPINGAVSARYLMPYLQKFRPDVILNYCVYPEGYAAVSVAQELGIPVILGAIGSDINRIPDPITRRLTCRTLERASLVLSVSDHLRDQVIRLGVPADRTRMVRNGCDFQTFYVRDRTKTRVALKLDESSKLVVFVGGLIATKGLRELLDAIVMIRPSYSNLHVVCIGDGILKSNLEQRAVQGGIARFVHFPGQLSSEHVAQWMGAADVFCLPSYAEGCPNVIVEALASGRPVVATRVGGIPELVDETCGLLVPPGDAAALAEALGKALDKTWDAVAISCKHRRGWDQVAFETYQVCMDAVAGQGSCPAEEALTESNL